MPNRGHIFLWLVFVLLWTHTGAAVVESTVAPTPSSDATPLWNRANLVFAAWCLLAIIALLGVSRWRTLRRRQQIAIDDKTNSEHLSFAPATSTSTDDDLDLQLLRFLSDGTASGLSTQIDVYLKAFDSDRHAARIIFAEGDQKKIQRIAHRLVAHAGAVRCIPLVNLATGVQTAAAMLTPQQLDHAMREIDREFVNLTSKLDALRASTGPG